MIVQLQLSGAVSRVVTSQWCRAAAFRSQGRGRNVPRYELRQRVGYPAIGSRNGSSSENGCSNCRCERKYVATIDAMASNAIAATATCYLLLLQLNLDVFNHVYAVIFLVDSNAW